MGLYATSVAYGPPDLRDADADASLVSELRTAIEDQRSIIQIVPGEGSVNGVWVFNGDVYAFRNEVGGSNAGMYKSTSTGWSKIDLGTALNFDGTSGNGEPVPGDVGAATTISGATSNAEGDLMGISFNGEWTSGSTGVMVLTNITGNFQDNEDLKMPLLAFDAGSKEISSGDTITGASSGKTATVTSVTISSGSYAGSDAAGYISIKNNSGTWTNNEAINIKGAQHALVNGASEPTSVNIAKASGTEYAITLPANGKYEFVNYNFRGESSGLTMYGVNTVGKGFSWDGTTFIPILTGMDDDTPEHVIAHQKHLFYSFPNGSMQHSSIGFPNKWSAITGAAEISVGDDISGFSTEVNNVMSVFTKNNAFMLYGSSSADWQLRKFHTGSGAVPYTLQKMDQTFFLDDRGITSLYAVQYFGDFQSSVTSDKIDPYIQKKKDNAIDSLRVRGKNQYRIYFDDKTGIEMTFINKKVQGLMPFTMKHQIKCIVSEENSNGFEVLYAGFDDGYIRKLDSGTSFDGLSVPSFVRSAYFHYDTPSARKRFRQIGLEINADTATTLTVTPSYDFGGTYSPKTSPISNSYSVSVTADQWSEDDISNKETGVTVVASERVRINGIGTNMGLIIENDSIYDKPITLQGAVVEFTPRGVRR